MTLQELKIIYKALTTIHTDSWSKREAQRLIQLEIDRKTINPVTNKPYTLKGLEHTCIKDDGGTPNRKCYACEAEKSK